MASDISTMIITAMKIPKKMKTNLFNSKQVTKRMMRIQNPIQEEEGLYLPFSWHPTMTNDIRLMEFLRIIKILVG